MGATFARGLLWHRVAENEKDLKGFILIDNEEDCAFFVKTEQCVLFLSGNNISLIFTHGIYPLFGKEKETNTQLVKK